MIVQDGAAYGRVQEAALVVDFVGVCDVLIVVCGGQVDHFAGKAQPDRAQCFHLAGFQSKQHFVNVRERAAFALRARLRLGQVVEAENHVLRWHGDRLA